MIVPTAKEPTVLHGRNRPTMRRRCPGSEPLPLSTWTCSNVWTAVARKSSIAGVQGEAMTEDNRDDVTNAEPRMIGTGRVGDGLRRIRLRTKGSKVRWPTGRFRRAQSVGLGFPDESETISDKELLDRSRTQWLFGDWVSLTMVDRATLERHPQRSQLALFVVSAHQQLGNEAALRELIHLARGWGCTKQDLARMLLAGVHNTLGRARAITEINEPSEVVSDSGKNASHLPVVFRSQAFEHFQASVAVGMPGSDVQLYAGARAREQMTQMGLPLSSQLHEALATHCRVAISRRQEGLDGSPFALSPPARLGDLVERCLSAPDVHERVDWTLANSDLDSNERLWFLFMLSDGFRARNDPLTALHFLGNARDIIPGADPRLVGVLVRKFIAIGRPEEAMDLVVPGLIDCALDGLSDSERESLRRSYDKAKGLRYAKTEHGHEVLLAYLRQHLDGIRPTFGDRKPVLIEIGTTRENVAGQGSTQKIAEFCKGVDVHFISVDMDPHNSQAARDVFARLDVPFEAVTMKGEDYLRGFDGLFDFVFLDAYDFDHGKHGELRQSRYERFLGSRIADEQCHKMHLECAQAVEKKLAAGGLVCIDDTWLENGLWVAKGTLAMPFLLDNGFRLLDVRNRAALLGRSCPNDQKSRM